MQIKWSFICFLICYFVLQYVCTIHYILYFWWCVAIINIVLFENPIHAWKSEYDKSVIVTCCDFNQMQGADFVHYAEKSNCLLF